LFIREGKRRSFFITQTNRKTDPWHGKQEGYDFCIVIPHPLPLMKTLFFLLLALPTLAQISKIPTWTPLETTSTAATLRAKNATYIRALHYVAPKPATTAAQLTAINPHLSEILPDFDLLLEDAQLSSRYKQLYDTKHKRNRSGNLLTPHNYFDCETALLLTHPTTKQKVFLLQSDMDVVTDGSDPGRSPLLPQYDLARTSDWFLPETAYSWVNTTSKQSPFLDYYPEALAKLQKLRVQLEAEPKQDPGVVWREMIRTCDSQIHRIKERGLHASTKTNLKKRRFLLATRDPFVVLPVPWVKSSAPFSPRIGDYAAVINKHKINPAILGDAGPSSKTGEASLRLARALNPKANGKTRAVSELTVTYLLFPNSAGPRSAPNLPQWHAKVATLLTNIGGLGDGYTLHQWK